MENVAEKLFNLLGTKFDNTDIKTLDSKGKETTDMEEIDMFSFDFEVGDKNYGPVVILISAKDNLEVYYGDNTSKTLDKDAKRKWENLIEHLSVFSRTNRLGFSLKHTTDLKYDMSNIADITESFKNIFEGYYGTSKTSYNPQGKAKIIIKHSKKLGEEDARFRNINALFIENADGERFKLPFKKLAGARAMARHVTEGGNPYDLFGLHISEMVKDINTLGGFVRRSKAYEELEEAASLIETGRSHYDTLRKNLKQIAGKRGYATYKEGWEPSEITESDRDVDSIRKLFTEKSINSRIEDALPLLARLQELAGPKEELVVEEPEEHIESVRDGMKEITEFEQWADQVVEGTWAVPETPRQLKALQKFLATEQPLGVDAMNVTSALDDVIGDDDLFDELEDLAAKEPDADARPIVIDWIKNAIKHSEFRDPAALKNLRIAIQSVREDCNSCSNELDADDEQHLHASVNKDLDKYAKGKKVISTMEQDKMKDLSEYVDDVEGTPKAEVKDVMESIEPIEEEVNLKDLMERTNYLLRK